MDKDFVNFASKTFGDGAILTRQDIQKVVDKTNVKYPYWLVSNSEYRADRGKYQLPLIGDGRPLYKGSGDDVGEAIQMINNPLDKTVTPLQIDPNTVRMQKLQDESDITVPELDDLYVPFGFYKDLKTIMDRKVFFPVMIVGPSGNGKTKMVMQAANEAKRPLIRVNISIETDSEALLGGPILVNGNIVNRPGPVILAMKNGAILLLDEIDRGSNKLLCIQSILEGEPYFDKNTGEMITPEPGFQIIATANTKGKGSDDGKYLAQILDEALLERFAITIEQEYPNETTEKTILTKVFEELTISEPDFVEKLVTWARNTRSQYDNFGEQISTRRLVDVCKAYALFPNRIKAVSLCINRFDDATRGAFLEFYQKLDETVNTVNAAPKMDASTADIWFEEIEEEAP